MTNLASRKGVSIGQIGRVGECSQRLRSPYYAVVRSSSLYAIESDYADVHSKRRVHNHLKPRHLRGCFRLCPPWRPLVITKVGTRAA